MDFLELILTELECPKCVGNITRAPFYHCSKGHSICLNCTQEALIECSSCRVCFNQKMNDYLLENYLKNLKHACKYREQGCKVMLPSAELEEHTDLCEFRQLSCPIYRCAMKGHLRQLISHMKKKHPNKMFDSMNALMMYCGNTSNMVQWTTYSTAFFSNDDDQLFCFCFNQGECHVHAYNMKETVNYKLLLHSTNSTEEEEEVVSTDQVCIPIGNNYVRTKNVNLYNLKRRLPTCLQKEERKVKQYFEIIIEK